MTRLQFILTLLAMPFAGAIQKSKPRSERAAKKMKYVRRNEGRCVWFSMPTEILGVGDDPFALPGGSAECGERIEAIIVKHRPHIRGVVVRDIGVNSEETIALAFHESFEKVSDVSRRAVERLI